MCRLRTGLQLSLRIAELNSLIAFQSKICCFINNCRKKESGMAHSDWSGSFSVKRKLDAERV